jgi:UTP--glucose-1-phosphate uridylyltransferase
MTCRTTLRRMPTANQPASRPARKAVIPVAGLGTRFLPATKAVPKELLPVVDRPALQYIVEEAARAGLPEVLMVTGRNKAAIEDYFDRHPELETTLEKKGDADRLASVHESTEVAQVHFVRQGEARGLGHAVLQAAAFVGNEPFAVLLGDDLIDARDHLLEHMLAVQAEHGGSVIALLDVGRENIDKYGAVAVEPGTQTSMDGDEVVTVTGLVEKPPVDEAPSSLAIIGRYVLAPEVFDVLRETPPGRGGEIQLTDALATLVERGEPLHGVVFSGRRYDTGDRLDYLKAVVRLASERNDLGPAFTEFLREFVADLPSAGASPS